MRRVLQFGLAVMATLAALSGAALAQSKNALVIGNSAYERAPALKTPATDAAIVAETLRAAGYDVTDLRDVRQAAIGQTMRDFLDKVAASGPEGIAFVYYSGYGAQSEGENFLVPVDADINANSDVADEAFRLRDLLDELAKTPLAARIVLLDASRDHKLITTGGKPVAKGLAMGETMPGMLLGFAAAPGAVSIDGDGDYSLFTGTLVTMMRQPGLDMEQIFKATRLQVNQATGGAQTPWMVSSLAVEVGLFAATAAAPEVQTAPSGVPIPPKEEREVTKETLQTLEPDAAYAAAVEEDTLEAYQNFVQLFPKSKYAAQVWQTIETRRETILWQRALAQNTARAYWNYLKRYPNGAHAAEAQAELDALSAARTPPTNYVPTPEPLPPDYADEAVGLAEIVPEGAVEPASVFDLLAPLFLPPPEVVVIEVRRDLFPDRIPRWRGDPADRFKKRDRDGKNRDGKNRDGKDRDGKNRDGKDRNKGGITGKQRGPEEKTGPDKKTGGAKKTGVGIPPSGGAKGQPPGGGRRATPPGTGGAKPPAAGTGAGTPGAGKKTGVGLPPRPPAAGGATSRPTSPAAPGAGTGRPTTPGGAAGTITGRPVTPGPGNRPGLPPVPGAAKPATPAPAVPGVGTRPGLPPATVRPGTPAAPTVKPAVPPTAKPIAPVGKPVAKPPAPAIRPVAKPPAPAVKPAAKPPAPAIRPAAKPPARPVARPPARPPAAARPVARPPAARPAPRPVARPPVARPAPRPAARPAPPPRPAPRAPVCSVVGGRRVCR